MILIAKKYINNKLNMKLIFIFIFSLLFIDIACICGPRCKPGEEMECPKRKMAIPMGYCQLKRQCKCVRKKSYDNLKIKDRINNISNRKNKI